MTTEPTLREKLERLLQEHLDNNILVPSHRGLDYQLKVPITLQEIQRVCAMLRESEAMEGKRAWYTVTHRANIAYSATGPALYNMHEVPEFKDEHAAESLCRCLSRAFAAGMRRRSEEFRELLQDGER